MAATGRLDRTGRWPDGGEFDIRAADGTTTFATHAVMLPTGKVLWYSIPSHPDRPLGPRHLAVAVLWDPSKGTGPDSFKRVNPPIDPATGQPVNIWCSGQSLLEDGRVLVTGGNLMYTVESPGGKFAGLNHVYTFDPFSERWKRQPNMRARALVPDQPAAAGRPHVHHGRARRARLRRQGRGHRAVHARRARAAGAAG